MDEPNNAHMHREQHAHDEREEDLEGLMVAVAETLTEAEKAAATSQEARDGRDARDDLQPGTTKVKTPAAGTWAEQLLQGSSMLTMGSATETLEERRRRTGKAPAAEMEI